MAKNFHTDNKAFMLYKDWEDIFQALDSSEEIGELVMALFAYAKRGETPKLSGGAKIAFLMMRAAIERDGIAWEEMCAQRSECGKKGGRPKKSDESEKADEKVEQSEPEQADTPTGKAEEKPQGINDTAEKPKAFSQTKRFSEKAKKADKDIDIDKDKDTDIDIDKDTDKDKDKAIDKEKKKDAGTAKSVVRSFGTHKNIMLTSEQYNELESRCRSAGLSLESYISKLSQWLFTKDRHCTDPYRIISGWLDNDSKRKTAAKPKERQGCDLSWYDDYAMNFDLSKFF
jgi:hypothetical protein